MTAIAEVAEKGGDGVVDVGHRFAEAVLDILVMVPAAGGEGDEAHSGFDKTTGEEHALARLRGCRKSRASCRSLV